jgi:hypothetical protein
VPLALRAFLVQFLEGPDNVILREPDRLQGFLQVFSTFGQAGTDTDNVSAWAEGTALVYESTAIVSSTEKNGKFKKICTTVKGFSLVHWSYNRWKRYRRASNKSSQGSRWTNMKVSKLMHGCIVALTCFGFLSADLARAAGPAVAKIRDVALQSAGVLQGQVVDQQGVPQAGKQVAAVQSGKAISVAKTDEAGRFTMASLPGGVYELQTASNSEVCRLWAPRTAPPAAQDRVLLVSNSNVVLGQHGGGGALGWLANPWVLGGIVAAAIAIPLAVASNDDDDAS